MSNEVFSVMNKNKMVTTNESRGEVGFHQRQEYFEIKPAKSSEELNRFHISAKGHLCHAQKYYYTMENSYVLIMIYKNMQHVDI